MTLAELKQLIADAAQATRDSDFDAAMAHYETVLSHVDANEEDAARLEQRMIALREWGQLHHMQNQPNVALAIYRQYVDEARVEKHKIEALVLLGIQHVLMGAYAEAMPLLRDALNRAEATSDHSGQAMAYGGIGLVYNGWGRYEDALINFQKSNEIWKDIDNWLEQARTSMRIGLARVNMGQVDKAIIAFRQSVGMAVQAAGPTAVLLEMYGRNNLGEAYLQAADMNESIKHFRQSIALAESVNPHLADDMYRNMGVAHLALGNTEKAFSYLRQALEANSEGTNLTVRLQIIYSMALAEIEHGDAETGLKLAQELQQESEENDVRSGLANANYLIGLYHSRRGEETEAQEKWQQSLFLAHETGQRELLWRTHYGLAQLGGNPTLAAVHMRIAGEVINQIAEPIEDPALRQKYLSSPVVKKVLAGGQD